MAKRHGFMAELASVIDSYEKKNLDETLHQLEIIESNMMTEYRNLGIKYRSIAPRAAAKFEELAKRHEVAWFSLKAMRSDFNND